MSASQLDAPDALDDQRKMELLGMLHRMQRLSDAFYYEAVRIGNHPFIEITGFMNEYIKLAHENLDQGVDFAMASTHTGRSLTVKPHQVMYFAEKLNCILGPTLAADRALLEAFIEALTK